MVVRGGDKLHDGVYDRSVLLELLDDFIIDLELDCLEQAPAAICQGHGRIGGVIGAVVLHHAAPDLEDSLVEPQELVGVLGFYDGLLLVVVLVCVWGEGGG